MQVLILFLVLVFLLYAPSQRPLSLWSLINDQSMVSVEKTSTNPGTRRYAVVREGTRSFQAPSIQDSKPTWYATVHIKGKGRIPAGSQISRGLKFPTAIGQEFLNRKVLGDANDM